MRGRAAFWIAVSLFSAVTLAPAPQVWAYGTGKKKEETKRRPALEYEKFRRTREVDTKMADKRRSIRDQTQKLLELEAPDSKERPDLLFRLAENYFDEAISYFNQAQRLDDQLIGNEQNEDLRRRIEADKKKLREQEDIWRSKAIDQYKEIVTKYPTYPGRDEVMYFLGMSLWDLQRFKEALAVYKELITNYKKSKYICDAYLAFGEYYFDQSATDSSYLDKALMAYKETAKYEACDIYPYALYKQAWCYYNLHEWDKSLDMFQTVIYLEDMEGGGRKKRFEIRKEALKDFTLTYAQAGKPAENAPRVIQKLAPKEAHGMLVGLAGMYFGSGQDRQAYIMYKYLIKEEGCSAEVPFYQGRVVECSSRLGKDSQAKRNTVKQVRTLVEKFNEVKECIKSPTPKQKERIKEAQELAEVTLRTMCRDWYKEAKETKQRETFLYAQELFGDYLEIFPQSSYTYDLGFAYGEILYHHLGQYDRAADQYMKLVSSDLEYIKKNKQCPKEGKDKEGRSSPCTYLCDAAYKAFLCNQELQKEEQRKEKKAKKQKEAKLLCGEKQAIPKNRQRLILSAEVYLDKCPKAEEDKCDINYLIAQTYEDFAHSDEAVKRYDQVVSECPEKELSEFSVNEVLSIFECKKDWTNLDNYLRKYSKNERLMKNKKLRDTIAQMVSTNAFKKIVETPVKKSTTEKSQGELAQHHQKALEYIRFVKEFPKDALADKSLYNAAIEFALAERLDLARKARQKLIDEYPKSELVPETIFSLAENYERLANFDEAATVYETYANRYKEMKGLGKAVSYGKKGKEKKEEKSKEQEPKVAKADGQQRTWNSEDAQVALVNAGIYREALHQYPKAIRNREEYLLLFSDTPDAPRVMYSLGMMFETIKIFPKAIEYYQKYHDRYFDKFPDQAIAARMKKALLLLKLKRNKEAEKEYPIVLNSYRRLPSAKRNDAFQAAEAAAHAQFLMSEPIYREYAEFRFTSADEKKLVAQVQEKTKRLDKVQKIYTDIVKIGQAEWAIASLYQVGRAYENFAETLCKAPLPAGLTPEQKDLYKLKVCTELPDSLKLKEKMIAFWEASVSKGSELGFYSAYTQRALEKLQQWAPETHTREDLGFELTVVADVAGRAPMLTTTWEEFLKNPDLLNEAPLRNEKQTMEVQPVNKEPAAAEPRQGSGADASNKPTKDKVDSSKKEQEPESGSEESPGGANSGSESSGEEF